MKTTFLSKTLIIILATVLLSAVFTALVFNYTGSTVFANQKAQELSPRAKFISDMTSDYLQGYVGTQTFQRAIGGMEYRIWDASVYVFGSDGYLIAYPNNIDNTENLNALNNYVSKVLSGASVASPTSVEAVGVVIGEPVLSDDGNVIAAVFLIKPLDEVKTALGGLTIALMISMLAVMAIMMIPAYFTSKRMTRPLKQISEVAISMAKGDFNVRADEAGSVELVNLSKSFNFLCDELSRTISSLTHERNKLMAVINGLGEGIVATDRSGAVTHYNQSALRLLGCTESAKLPTLPTYAPVADAINESFTNAGQVHTGEIRRGDMVLSFTVTPLFDADNTSKETVTLIRDVTEAVRLEQTRRDYVANVSHELRTPIASIRSLADALNDGMIKTDADKSRYYGYILRESMRLSHLIDDLLELSRLQSGTVSMQKSEMDITDLVYDAADRFSAAAAGKNMTISVSIPCNCGDEALKVFANSDRVEQVIIILLDNAIKHSDGGCVDISLSEMDDERLKVAVINDGIIEEADLEHIFDRFYKVDRSHSGKGTGLGLSIAKEIMTLMGEELWASCGNGHIEFAFTLKRAAKKENSVSNVKNSDRA